MGNNIIMEGIRSLYDPTMGGLKMKHLNKRIINLARINMRSITLITGLVILVLFLKTLVDSTAK